VSQTRVEVKVQSVRGHTRPLGIQKTGRGELHLEKEVEGVHLKKKNKVPLQVGVFEVRDGGEQRRNRRRAKRRQRENFQNKNAKKKEDRYGFSNILARKSGKGGLGDLGRTGSIVVVFK